MNKMAEKVVPVMTDEEIEQLISDHYRGEAQTLTVGAEENLLKLAELRGNLDEASEQRWSQIKADFVRHQNLGDQDDPVANIASQLSLLQKGLSEIGSAIASKQGGQLDGLVETIRNLQLQVNVEGQDGELFEKSLASFSTSMQTFLERLELAISTNSSLDEEVLSSIQEIANQKQQTVQVSSSKYDQIRQEIAQEKSKEEGKLITD